MKIAFRLGLLAAVAGLGFWLWTIFFPSPEKIVLGKIASLATTANITAADGSITRAGKASSVVSEFTSDAEIALDVTGVGARTLSGRDEIREAAMGGFASVPSLKVQFLDTTARVAPDKQSAEATCTARVSAGDSKDFGIQELHFLLKKIDGDWLITRVETVKTLQ
jgi:ketosteroid isomerase-like protein